jgi:hypothetical protein
MALLILAPAFFLRINKKVALIYLALLLVGVPICMYFNLSFTPMMTFTKKILPPFIAEYYGYAMCSTICTVALFFIHSLGLRMLEHKKNFNYILISLMMLAIIFSCIKITHQFSSRYVFQAAPFFLIIASFHYKSNNYSKILNIVGLLIGVISLVNYC